MSFPDWTFYTSNPLIEVLNTGEGLVEGVGSLHVDFRPLNNVGSAHGSVTDLPNPRGYIHGSVRTLVHIDELGDGTDTDRWFVGCLAMQSQLDVTGGGAGYAAGILLGAVHHYIVGIYRTGLVPGYASFTTLQTGPATITGTQFTRALELTWNATGYGVALTLKRGTALDFSDLTTEAVVLHVSTPLLTTVSQGIFAHNFEGTGQKKCTFDRVQFRRITTT